MIMSYNTIHLVPWPQEKAWKLKYHLGDAVTNTHMHTPKHSNNERKENERKLRNRCTQTSLFCFVLLFSILKIYKELTHVCSKRIDVGIYR